MRLGDVDLVGSALERQRLIEAHNRTAHAFPADRSVGELFACQAESTPDAEALVDAGRRWTYRELQREVAQLAAYLTARGVGPEVRVGALLHRSSRLVVALLAILRAGGSYVPLNPDLPIARLRSFVLAARPPVILFERSVIANANTLLWECPAVALIACLDSDDVGGELEAAGPRMAAELWDHVARRADDAIGAGGWRSARTGELLSAEVVAAYVDAAVAAVGPLLAPRGSVLEVGCGSGLTLAGLAPRATRYVGTDLSAEALSWARRTCERRGLRHVSLHALDAMALDELPDEDAGPFDLAVLNSVVQSFGGYNYLRAVLRDVIARVRDGGAVFVGHVWDPRRREAIGAGAHAGERPHAHRVGREPDALFVAREFFEDLTLDLPRAAAVEIGAMGCEAPEIAAYAYDVIIRVRDAAAARPGSPRKSQEDRRAAGAVPPPVAAVDRHRPDAGAYVIQTSGSSGAPRSVEIEMRSLMNLLWWYRDACAIDAHSRVVQVIPSSFDASLKNYLAPLVFGATLVLSPDGPFDPEALLSQIERESVTVLNPGVPSMAYALAELAAERGWEPLRSLRCLALGGEPPSLDRLRPWLRSGSCGARVLNVYGPTECTDIACWYEVREPDLAGRRPLPIGGPVYNAQAYVLSPRLTPEPIGVVGELCVSGAGLARGYLGDPDYTAERFVPHPFRAGERIYRTGDLARRLDGGEIVLHGRADSQVKVRGHRVELAEVESALRRVPGVIEAAVLAEGGDEDRQLVGYVVAGGDLDPGAVRESLRRILPAAVVPAEIVLVDAWPLNPHGKVDRHALRALRRSRQPAGRPPRSALERTLAGLWREVLDLELEPGAEEPFFDLGGHSLAAASLISLARRSLMLDLSLTDVYRAQTIAAQAALLEQRQRGDGFLHRLGTAGGSSLFCFPPIAGFAWTFAELARRLDGRLTVYAFDFVDAPDPADAAAGAIAAVLAAGERCLLAGYSAGGLLAASVAAALEGRGIPVGGLVLFDAAPPALRERYADADARALAEQVIADPRLAMHLESVGREHAARTVAAYARWYARAEPPRLAAVDILTIAAAGTGPAWAQGWGALTKGQLTTRQGGGGHDDLLSGEHVAGNAEIASAWLAARAGQEPSPRSRPRPERSASVRPDASPG